MPAARAARSFFGFSVLLMLLALLNGARVAAAPAVVIDNDFEPLRLGDYLDVLDGDAARIDRPESLARQFRPLHPAELTRNDHARWLRLGILNRSGRDSTLVLQLPFPVRSDADYRISAPTPLYLSPLHGPDPVSQGGALLLQVPAAGIGLIYLRIAGTPLLDQPLQLTTLDTYLRTPHRQGWLRGIGLGLLAATLVVGVIALLITRDTIYAWFIGTTLMHLLPAAPLWLTDSMHNFANADPARWYNAGWLMATAMVLQLAVRFPAYPPDSRHWPRLLHTLSALAALAAMTVLAQPQWLPVHLQIALVLPTILITLLGAMLGYLLTQSRVLLGFAVARFWIFLAALLLITRPASPNDLPFSYISEILIGTGIEMLLLFGVLAARSLARMRLRNAEQGAIAVAEAESRARTELTAAMAHRIRTPVSGVLGMVEMLQDGAASPAQRDQLDTLQRAGNELLNAVSELSDFSRFELGSNPLQRASFDLQALIVESVEGFRGLASTHALELITDFAPGLPRYVSGDQTRVRQLLLQLLHHAIAHYRDGEILLRVEGENGSLQFALTVFGDRVADGTANDDTDAELRLAIARQLTTTLGGSIQLPASDPRQPSMPGHIWRASFTLPLPTVDRRHVSDAPEQALRHRHLLIVDDSTTFREVVQRRAEHWGMHVHSAGTLSEGLAHLNNQRTIGEPVDAMLLDAELPEFATPDGIARLRDAGLPRDVILLATQPEAEHGPLARSLTVRHILLKPLDHTSLQLALLEALNAPTSRPAAPDNRPLRCLIAEDNPINAQVLQGMLNRLAVLHTTAVNGQAAVEAFQREPFDLVLMDCDMPVMDGFEAARRIREIQSNRQEQPLPIIALTANTLEELGERARTGVMDAHLVKPVRLQALRQVLEHWSGRALAPAADNVTAD
jgi:CheY-like chemotaxis protein